jgi:urea transport system permease protein
MTDELLKLLNDVFNVVSTSSVLLLAALGLTIVFGLMGVINMAHGEFLMLGGYTAFVVQNGFKLLGEPWSNFYVFVALIAAFLVTAIAGFVLERGVIRFLYGRPLETLLATWGISLMLQQFVRSVNWVLIAAIAIFLVLFFGSVWLLKLRSNWQIMQKWAIASLLPLSAAIAASVAIFLAQTYKLAVTQPWFGPQNLNVDRPKWLTSGLPIGPIQIPYVQMFIIVLTIICVIGVYLFLNRSAWGLRIRAVTQNRAMSSCLGIPTNTVDALTFAIGSGLAGIAGCALAIYKGVGPNTGQNYIIDTFMVVVVGGVGKLVGSIVAAFALGTTNYVIESDKIAPLLASLPPISESFKFFAGSSMAKVLLYSLIVVFLQFRPGGLFPQKGRSVE